MNTKNEGYLKRMFNLHVPNTVILASWMEDKGFSRDLQHSYLKSGWLESIGTGAFKRPNESLNWQGGVYTLQNRSKIDVHVGGISALTLLGYAHYLRLGNTYLYLFTQQKTVLPAWFKKYDWNAHINQVRTSFLPYDLGLINHQDNNLTLFISSAERAFFECIYLVPEKMDLVEVYHIMTGLLNLRPRLLNKLLLECNSVKVKRLFLFMAEKAGHQWGKKLDISNIYLGKGDRSIVKNGVYNSKYGITVPLEIAHL